METTVKLIAFGGTRKILGAAEQDFTLAAPCTAEQFLAEVCLRYPDLAPFRRSIRVAVNGAYAAPDDPVRGGDEIALIPPVAGG